MAESTSPRRYSVLYFKRTNKVHKFRGTTREDGILIVSPPPSCICKLVSATDDDDVVDDDEQDDDEVDDDEVDEGQGPRKGGGKAKKRAYAAFKNRSRKATTKKSVATTVWSGVDPDISRRAHSLLTPSNNGTGAKTTIDVDDTLIISGQWECVIVSSMDDDDDEKTEFGKSSGAPLGAPQRKAGPGLAGAGITGWTLGPNAARPLPRVHPLTASRVVGNTIPSSPPRATTGGVARKGFMAPGMRRPLGSTDFAPSSGGVKSIRMRQPKGKSSDSDGDDENDRSELERTRRAGMLSKIRNKVGPTGSGSSMASVLMASKDDGGKGIGKNDGVAANDGDDFPGAKGDRIIVPSYVRGVLRPHQRVGIAFLWNCVTGVNEGVARAYANVGANSARDCDSFDGKSEDDDDDDDDNEDSDDDNYVSASRKKACVESKLNDMPRGAVLADEMGLGKTLMTISTIYAYHRLHRDRRFIVVCPSSLVSNWSKEFDKWLGRASQPKRIVVRNGIESEGLRNLKSFVPLKQLQSEVLILSYEIFRMHVNVIKESKKIAILVVDEGHRLKNTSGSQILTALNSIKVESRILISGTPIQNNLSEFYNLVNFAVPGILGDLAGFRRIYERPMSQSNQKNATVSQKMKGRKASKALEAITSHFVLRRLQRDILNKLLKKRTEVLLFCRPTENQCKIYQSITENVRIGGVDEISNPLMLLTKLRKLCTHPSLLQDDKVVDDASLSGKLIVLGNLLDSIRRLNPTDKVVIISNFTSALTVIEDSLLRKKRLSFVRLDGSTDNKSRGAIVDTFNRGSVDKSFAFLLSSKAGGCGLNLIGANRLIMVDADWNPATDHQAMARIFREGQTKTCFIYRMFTAGTIEEVIYQRQLQKGNLAKLANDGKGGTNAASFTKEELHDCFTLKLECKCDTKRKLGKQWGEFDVDGCDDMPLLQICENENVTYVRVVENDEESTTTLATLDVEHVDADSFDNDMLSESDRSLSEEEEFDG
ncbi:hypothetical protein ACHAXA_005899 [Cyclostephanos tholiformis]|uniref:Uncharacterized protein n=1 Tax=Cyclostephanos tholiformis TaxID=382380 RepID=A0ABD3SCZ0_9STRA